MLIISCLHLIGSSHQEGEAHHTSPSWMQQRTCRDLCTNKKSDKTKLPPLFLLSSLPPSVSPSLSLPTSFSSFHRPSLSPCSLSLSHPHSIPSSLPPSLALHSLFLFLSHTYTLIDTWRSTCTVLYLGSVALKPTGQSLWEVLHFESSCRTCAAECHLLSTCGTLWYSYTTYIKF